MTQADFTIANQTFPNTRAEINTSLQALATNSAGNSAPSTTFPNQWHFDSDGNVLYMRNKDNDAWVQILTIGATSDDVQSLFANVIAEGTSATGVTIDGMLIKDGGFTASKNCVISTTGNETTLEMISTDADASSGPRLSMNRQSGSPADGDDLGKIFFFGKNDAAEDQGYAEIMCEISDASDGTEDGRLLFNMRQAGATVEGLRIEGSNGVVVNDQSGDVDFRVESNSGTHMLFVDGGNNVLIVGGIDGSGTVPVPTNANGGTDPVFQLQGANNSAQYTFHISAGIDAQNNPGSIIFSKSRDNTLNGNTILQNGDRVGELVFCAADGTDRNSVAALICVDIDGAIGGNDTPGRIEFHTTADGANSATERMRINNDGKIAIGNTNPQEFMHLMTSGSTALRVSGGSNNNKKVQIGYDNSNGPYVSAGSSGIVKLQFYVDNTTLVGEFRDNGDFYTNDGTVHSLSDARVKSDINDLTDGLEIVKQLKPRTFKYTSKSQFYNEKDKDEIKYGFVADEVELVASQYTSIATGKIDGETVDDLKNISATKMIPMLVKAIQELEAKITALENN